MTKRKGMERREESWEIELEINSFWFFYLEKESLAYLSLIQTKLHEIPFSCLV